MLVLVLVFAVLFALTMLTPVSNLLELPRLYELLGLADAVPWGLLIAGVVVPPLCFAFALLLGRRRPLFDRALVLTAALAASSALGLGIIAWAGALQPPI